MARSLSVHHDEAPATNPRLTGFLILAAVVLLGSALQGTPSEAAPAPASPVVQVR